MNRAAWGVVEYLRNNGLDNLMNKDDIFPLYEPKQRSDDYSPYIIYLDDIVRVTDKYWINKLRIIFFIHAYNILNSEKIEDFLLYELGREDEVRIPKFTYDETDEVILFAPQITGEDRIITIESSRLIGTSSVPPEEQKGFHVRTIEFELTFLDEGVE